MNRATPIVLVALLALLGLYVAFFEIRPETRFWSKAETRERSARVFDVERSDALARSIRLLAITQDVDPTRPFLDTSGYVHVVTDLFTVHDYTQDPDTFRKRYSTIAPDAGMNAYTLSPSLSASPCGDKLLFINVGSFSSYLWLIIS